MKKIFLIGLVFVFLVVGCAAAPRITTTNITKTKYVFIEEIKTYKDVKGNKPEELVFLKPATKEDEEGVDALQFSLSFKKKLVEELTETGFVILEDRPNDNFLSIEIELLYRKPLVPVITYGAWGHRAKVWHKNELLFIWAGFGLAASYISTHERMLQNKGAGRMWIPVLANKFL